MISKKEKLVVLAAGGTGGHLFPAIAVIEQMQTVRTHLITDRRCAKYLPADLPSAFTIIDLHLKMNGFKAKICSMLKIIRQSIKSLILLIKLKPDAIIGFGGYPTFPALAAASILRIPIIIHEQNCFLGKSNRFFAKFAKVLALSYPKTVNIPSINGEVVVVGDLVRKKIFRLEDTYSPFSEVFNIFIFGGSQGASVFSQLMPTVAKRLVELVPNQKIKIIQQAVQNEQPALLEAYKALSIECEIADFFYNIDEIYSHTQLVIARAGAGTIAELSIVGLPAIFVPYPYGENHQFFNAQAIEDLQGGWCYKQDAISADQIAAKIVQLINNRNILKEASVNLKHRVQKDAAKNLVDTVYKIIC